MNFAYFGSRPKEPSVLLVLLEHNGPVAIDVETRSIEDKTLVGIGFATSPNDAFYFPADSNLIPWWLLIDDRVKIFHNSSFDMEVLLDHNGIIPGPIDDTMIMAQTLGLPAKLSSLAMIYRGRVNEEINDIVGKKGKNQLTVDQAPVERIAKKCAIDCLNTYTVWEALKDKIPRRIYTQDMALLPQLRHMEEQGIPIDRDRLEQHKYRVAAEVLYYKHLGENLGFNPGSSQQVGNALKIRGHTILYNKKTGNPRLDETMLRTRYYMDPIAHLTLLYRQSKIMLSTFIISTLLKLDSEDRLHIHYNVAGAASGRLSTSPNSQNQPTIIRDIFIPSPGNEIVAWDFSQIEYRVVAHLSNDPKLLAVFADPKGDMHTSTMRELGIDSRRNAKAVNYSILFGGDEHTLLTKSGIPLSLGRKHIQALNIAYPTMAAWIEEEKRNIMKTGIAITAGGRVRRFPKIVEGAHYEVAAALREGINHIVQGTAAEIQKEAQLFAKDWHQWNTVHDEIDFDVHIGENIPLPSPGRLALFDTPIDIGRGKNWKEAKG